MKKAVQSGRCREKNVGWAESSGERELAVQPEDESLNLQNLYKNGQALWLTCDVSTWE